MICALRSTVGWCENPRAKDTTNEVMEKLIVLTLRGVQCYVCCLDKWLQQQETKYVLSLKVLVL